MRRSRRAASTRPGVVVEGGFGRVGGRRLAPGSQRFSGSAQMIGHALRNPRKRRPNPLQNRVGKWGGCGAPDHDQVVTQP